MANVPNPLTTLGSLPYLTDSTAQALAPTKHSIPLAEQLADKMLEAHKAKIRKALAAQPFTPAKSGLRKWAYHTGTLASVAVVCQQTGISGTIALPGLPTTAEDAFTFDYFHPLAVPSNALSLTRHLFAKRQSVEAQVLAGLVITLLSDKGKLPRDSRGTTAAERNMVLQSASAITLRDLLEQIIAQWDNPQVWVRLPSVSIDWVSHAGRNNNGQQTIQSTIQSYTRFIRNALKPEELENAELSAMYLSVGQANKAKKKGIAVHAVARIQVQALKGQKEQAAIYYKQLAKYLSPALYTALGVTIKSFDLYGLEHKQQLATKLRVEWNGKTGMLADSASKLADILDKADNAHLLATLDRFSDDLVAGIDKPKLKGMAAILAEKAEAARAAKGGGK